jgi:hypothetical protein
METAACCARYGMSGGSVLAHVERSLTAREGSGAKVVELEEFPL